MRRVLVERIPQAGERVHAARAESHHLLHVLRAQAGDRFRLADGAGTTAVGSLVAVEADGRAVFVVEEREAPTPPPQRVILLGMPKATLLEEAVQLGTEAGATHFLLVRARYSPPGGGRPERLQRILRTAVTQCGRADLPALTGPVGLAAALADPGLPATRWLAAPSGPGLADTPSPDAAVVAIGPEGGWSGDELDALEAAGFGPLGLGPFVLRTPTAVAAALARLWCGAPVSRS